jgi:hypothetical protein
MLNLKTFSPQPLPCSPRHPGRRALIAAAAAACTASLLRPAGAAVKNPRRITVTDMPGIDPTGGADSSAGFQAALSRLQDQGGGELIIPPGLYAIDTPLTYAGTSLTISGSGQTLSVLLAKNPIAVLCIGLLSAQHSVTIRDLGFCPLAAGGGGTALSIAGQNVVSGTQSCIIENVDFCVVFPGYTSFHQALVLNAVQRSNIRNVNMHSNAGILPGSCFASISRCIDVRFDNCSIDIVEVAFVVAAYSEGLHITGTVIANCDWALTTGATPYSGNGVTTPFVNLLGLYITDCEFNCNTGGTRLTYVNDAWISNTHLSTGNAEYPALLVLGCANVSVTNCKFTGRFNAASPQNWVGVEVAGLGTWPSNATIVDSCLFTNLGVGVSLQPGALNTTALNIRMSAPGSGYLVGARVAVGTYTIMAAQDLSGNNTNEIAWVASQAGINHSTDRLLFSQPN